MDAMTVHTSAERAGVSFVLAENPSISLAAGASRIYTISLFTDGFTVTA